MSRTLLVYSEIETFYDARKGLIKWMLTEGFNSPELRVLEGERLWNQYIAQNYANRRMDTHEYPDVKINKARFDAIYKERGLDKWLMYEKTLATEGMLRHILDLENLVDVPISIKGIKLFVNYFPYDLDESLQKELRGCLQAWCGGKFDIELLNIDPVPLTGQYYRQFNYVFKYDILAEGGKAFQESIEEEHCPNTTFLVPDILQHDTPGFKGTVADRIMAAFISIAQIVKVVPIGHAFYDAKPRKD